jgi:hypothetical protein
MPRANEDGLGDWDDACTGIGTTTRRAVLRGCRRAAKRGAANGGQWLRGAWDGVERRGDGAGKSGRDSTRQPIEAAGVAATMVDRSRVGDAGASRD